MSHHDSGSDFHILDGITLVWNGAGCHIMLVCDHSCRIEDFECIENKGCGKRNSVDQFSHDRFVRLVDSVNPIFSIFWSDIDIGISHINFVQFWCGKCCSWVEIVG